MPPVIINFWLGKTTSFFLTARIFFRRRQKNTHLFCKWEKTRENGAGISAKSVAERLPLRCVFVNTGLGCVLDSRVHEPEHAPLPHSVLSLVSARGTQKEFARTENYIRNQNFFCYNSSGITE